MSLRDNLIKLFNKIKKIFNKTREKLSGKGKSAIQKESLDLFELLDFLRDAEVQKKLSENPDLKLFAKKQSIEIDGKEGVQIELCFFNSKMYNYEKTGLEKAYRVKGIDDLLKDKFGKGSVWAVREAVL